MGEIFSQTLNNLLYIAVIAAISVVSRAIIVFLQVKRTEIATREKKTGFEEAMVSAIDLIQNSVDAVSQSYVDTLKCKGQFTAEAQIEAKNRALALIKSQLSENSKELISKTYSNLDSWLGMQVESYLKNNKVEVGQRCNS